MRTPPPEVPGYALRARVGRGANATVWRAEPVGSPGRLVAVKLLDTPAPGAARIIEREAAALAVLSHPNILQVLDVVPLDDGLALVTPYATGGSLADRLAAGPGGLDPLEVCEIGARLASALAAAHNADLVHRDVKPANVLFDREAQALLADFGTARLIGAVDDLTGTPAYLDPDVHAGHAPDAATDVYALGITLYECLAGVPPYAGATPAQTLAAADRGAHVPLGDHVSLPDGLIAVVAAAMARDRDRRPASATELAGDLDELGRALRSGAGPPPPPRRPAGRAGVLGARPPDDDAGDAPPGRWGRARPPADPRPIGDGDPASSRGVGSGPARTATAAPDDAGGLGRSGTVRWGPTLPSPTDGSAPAQRSLPRGTLIAAAIAIVAVPVVVTAVTLLGTDAETMAAGPPERIGGEPPPGATADPDAGDEADAPTPDEPEPDAHRVVADPCRGVDLPDDPGSLLADIDGRGCSVLVVWDGRELRIDDPDGEPARYELGADTDDVLLFGDWNCDGRDAPALYRPSDGQVFRFDALVDDDERVSVTGDPSGVTDGVPLVRTDADGCDRIEVAPPS